jgi:NTE family protein
MPDLKIGLALGSGAALGLAHIGVLHALEEMGHKPQVIAGTSIGACVGAAYLTGELDSLQNFSSSTGIMGVLGYLDVTFSRGGLVASEKVFERFRNPRTAIDLQDLPMPFGAVATDLGSGREIWIRDGDLLTALRATSAIPGLFPPVPDGRHWLVDGALVNPVPVSLCRALGADFVIGVALASSRMALPTAPSGKAELAPRAEAESRGPPWLERVSSLFDDPSKALSGSLFSPKRATPTAVEALVGSIDIMQTRIMRSRLVGEPPDVLVNPVLGRIGVLEFDRASEIIELGYRATLDIKSVIAQALARV